MSRRCDGTTHRMKQALTVGVMGALIFSATPSAAFASPDKSEGPLLDALIEVTDRSQSPSEAPLDGVASGVTGRDKATIDSTINGVDVVVPQSPSNPLTLDSADGGSLSVTLPFFDSAGDATYVSDGILAYENGNGSHTVPIAKSDGAIQIATVIENATAPTAYEYSFDIPAGARIEETSTGGLFILDAEDQFLAGIAPAWAKDASGAEVATHYVVDGSTITQIVEHTQANTYPIVADPYLGVQMVKSTAWVDRDSRGLTLSVTPTVGARLFGGAYLAGVYGWREVEARRGALSVQMEWQYICHQQFAFFKSTWNLDTWIYRTSYANSVANGCN